MNTDDPVVDFLLQRGEVPHVQPAQGAGRAVDERVARGEAEGLGVEQGGGEGGGGRAGRGGRRRGREGPLRGLGKGGGRRKVSLREGLLRSLEAAHESGKSAVVSAGGGFLHLLRGDPDGEAELLAGPADRGAAEVDKRRPSPCARRRRLGLVDSGDPAPDLPGQERGLPVGELFLRVAVGKGERVIEQPRGHRLVGGVGVCGVGVILSFSCCSSRAPDVGEVLGQGSPPLRSLGLVGERPAGVGGVGADLSVCVFF